jgi:hypothetical protein
MLSTTHSFIPFSFSSSERERPTTRGREKCILRCSFLASFYYLLSLSLSLLIYSL